VRLPPIPVQTWIDYGKRPCHLDTPRHAMRIWWSETGRGRIDGDGRCATVPPGAAALAAVADATVARERALGLPRIPSDRGWRDLQVTIQLPSGRPHLYGILPVDGGSAAIDVYLGAGYDAGSGRTGCSVTWSGSRVVTHGSIAMGITDGSTADRKVTDVHVLAHELAHLEQCTVYHGRRSATDLGDRIVEGTAEAVAAMVVGERSVAEGTFTTPDGARIPGGALDFLWNAGRAPALVLSASRAATASIYTPYANWPFWASLGGADARGVLALWRAGVRASTADRRQGYLPFLYRRYGEIRIQRAMLEAARFARFGGTLAGFALPYAFWHPMLFQETVDPGMPPAYLARLAPVADVPASAAVSLTAGRYGYVAVAWPAGATTLHLTLEGADAARLAAAVAVVGPDGAPVAVDPDGATYSLTRGDASADAVVEVALANGRRAPLAVTVGAELHGASG